LVQIAILSYFASSFAFSNPNTLASEPLEVALVPIFYPLRWLDTRRIRNRQMLQALSELSAFSVATPISHPVALL